MVYSSDSTHYGDHSSSIYYSFNEMFPIKFCTYVQQLLCTCVTVCECVNCEGESVKGYTLTTQSCHGNYYTFHSLREKVFSGFWSGILVKMFSAIPGGGGREGGREGEGEEVRRDNTEGNRE